jgi:hypothetical protein
MISIISNQGLFFASGDSAGPEKTSPSVLKREP